jgi:hypothetical protein
MFVGLAIGRPRLCRTPRPPDASHAILPCVLRFEASLHARIPSLSCWALGLGFEAQTKKPYSDGFVGKPPNPACSVRPPAKHLTRPPPCTGSIIHDFVLLVSPPCSPHLVPLSTGSLEPSLLVSPSPGGPSRLKTFRARSSPATTRTRPQPTLRTKPRVSPTPVVNHSSLKSGHPSTTGMLLVHRLEVAKIEGVDKPI